MKDTIDQSEVGGYVDRIRESVGEAGPVARDEIGTEIGTLLDSAAGFASGLVLDVVLLYSLLNDGPEWPAPTLQAASPTTQQADERKKLRDQTA